ncbi:hypothetical protein KSP35_03240 [Aquihabitans sp. G128]|uniref:hypothetical protein n=1 Tax=Aquihabitans sp. G128 TaxID=2849779 RepID=UPI001C23044A|nr:hypothetical protein [Aquihabitans sp. G128]QXC61860.1 hypothetical protein KSP35_03240 [Aquihabitans sp. G128]
MPGPPPRRRVPTWEAALMALASLVLGAVAATLLVVGHHPWDGDVIEVFTPYHGLHRGDVLAVLPAVASLVLAAWCWRRRG